MVAQGGAIGTAMGTCCIDWLSHVMTGFQHGSPASGFWLHVSSQGSAGSPAGTRNPAEEDLDLRLGARRIYKN